MQTESDSKPSFASALEELLKNCNATKLDMLQKFVNASAHGYNGVCTGMNVAYVDARYDELSKMINAAKEPSLSMQNS